MAWTSDGNEPYEHGLGKVMVETDRALGVTMAGETELTWVPKQGVHSDSELQEKGDEGALVVKMWCARVKEWADD